MQALERWSNYIFSDGSKLPSVELVKFNRFCSFVNGLEIGTSIQSRPDWEFDFFLVWFVFQITVNSFGALLLYCSGNISKIKMGITVFERQDFSNEITSIVRCTFQWAVTKRPPLEKIIFCCSLRQLCHFRLWATQLREKFPAECIGR